MPVAGDSSAAVHCRFGSIAIASAALSKPHALHAIGLGAALDLGELRAFGLVGRHDQLAAIAMRHAVLGAIGIEQAPAGDAGRAIRLPLG